MLTSEDIEDSNYIELKLYKKKCTENVYDINFSKEEFYNIMNRLKYKCFQKDCKQYVSGNLIYENFNNEDVKVYKTEVKNIIIKNHYIISFYNKSKLSVLNFESSKNINDINYIRKLIFRVSNRIYINFEIKKKNNNLVYNIYINYNHDDTVDLSLINDSLENILKTLAC
jgi:hypothetical protein